MEFRDVRRALERHGCHVTADDGDHTKWRCPCERHTADVPRHRTVSPGVVRSTAARRACLPEGWLQ
jgi:hypothetical protein